MNSRDPLPPVAPPRLVRLADAAPQPWRNGGGSTRELLRLPADAAGDEDWRVRLSVADIARDGPFSAFPGVRRWFAVLHGAGVDLGGFGRLTPRSAPVSFDGAVAPGCRLPGGPTRDLNLMLRGAAGWLEAVDAGRARWRPEAASAGLYTTVAGRCSAEGGEPVDVPADALLWFDAAPRQLVFERANGGGDGPALWIAATLHGAGA